MISDLILGAFAVYFFIQNRSVSKNWSFFFLFMGIAAFFGALFHGNEILGEQYRFFSWSLLSSSLIFAQLATYDKFSSIKLNMFFVLKSVMFLFLAIHYSQFLFMVADIAISLLGFVVIANYWFLKDVSNKISYGILISISSALIVIFRLDFDHDYLTANDIGHYISVISLMYISKGVGEGALNLEKVFENS